MTNTLTKDISTTILNPAVPADPGVPPSPAYCATTSTTTTPTLVRYVYDEEGELQAIGYSGTPVTTYTTTCYPATAGVPPTPAAPVDVAIQFHLGWNAGARSVGVLTGDGAATFSVGTGVVGAVVGLHSGASEFSFTGADHALYFHAGLVSVLESGVERTGGTHYAEDDVFRIERTASVVRYFMGADLLLTSDTPSYGEQFLESSLYSGGDAVLNAELSEVVTLGLGSGGAVLRLAAKGSGTAAFGGGGAMLLLAAKGSVAAYGDGMAILSGALASGSGAAEQGGGAVLLLTAKGSSSTYGDGSVALSSTLVSGSDIADQDDNTEDPFSAYSDGVAILSGATVSGMGTADQGGGAMLSGLQVVASSGAYTGGGAVLAAISARGEAGTAPAFALGLSQLNRIMASGYGLTSGNTTEPGSIELGPMFTLGGNYDYGGGAATLSPISASGVEGVKLDRSLAVAQLGSMAASGYGLTSGSSIQPSGAGLSPLEALGANYAYAGGNAVLQSLAAGSTPVAGEMAFAISSPKSSLSAFFRSSAGENAAIITAPKVTALARFGFHIKASVRPGSITAAATGVSLLSANITSPGVSLVASGVTSGVMGATIAAPGSKISCHFGVVSRISAPGVSVQADVSSGGVLTAAISAPRSRLTTFKVTAVDYFSAVITGPKVGMGGIARASITGPGSSLVAVFSVVLVASYEAYSANLTHASGDQAPTDEVTRYTNFPFTHIVRFQGDYFGVAADGLYLLGGATDDGASIAYAVKTCVSDFDAPELKNVASAYLSGRLGPLAVSLHAGEDGAESYAFDTLRGPLARTHREKFGRGVRNRYFALGLAGSDALELDGIELEINKTSRRI